MTGQPLSGHGGNTLQSIMNVFKREMLGSISGFENFGRMLVSAGRRKTNAKDARSARRYSGYEDRYNLLNMGEWNKLNGVGRPVYKTSDQQRHTSGNDKHALNVNRMALRSRCYKDGFENPHAKAKIAKA